MINIIGVRFRNSGKTYYFDPEEKQIRRGTRVIVETARGTECGTVVLTPRMMPDEKVVQPLKPIVRIATEEDLNRERENIEKGREAYRICRQKIREHNLDMKLVLAEYTFDNKKVLFYFTADGRVDFRDLVKDLASVFKTRIELRQIGVRDETKMLGGIGICGRPLCCSTYLSEFAPVSIKMAKEQNMSLNPTKISGVCGRLMCCLKNEEETYEYLNKNLPSIGDVVQTPDQQIGEVASVNVLRQQVRVIIENGDDKEMEEYPAEEIILISRRKKGTPRPSDDRKGDRAKSADARKNADKGKNAEGGKAAGENRRADNERTGERSPREKSGHERPARGERQDHSDRTRPDRQDKQDRTERPDRQEKRAAEKRRDKNPVNASAETEKTGNDTVTNTEEKKTKEGGRRHRRRRHGGGDRSMPDKNNNSNSNNSNNNNSQQS